MEEAQEQPKESPVVNEGEAKPEEKEGAVESETASLIERAEKAAQKIEAETKLFAELVKRNEAAVARLMLSGRSLQSSGTQKTPEQEDADKVKADVDAAMKRYK
jgi:hypothetical protein